MVPESDGQTFVVTFGGSLVGKYVPLLVAPLPNLGLTVTPTILLAGGASQNIVANGATLQIQGGASAQPGNTGFVNPQITNVSGNGVRIHITTFANTNFLKNGQYVYITGVTGNTKANGLHTVTNVTANSFEFLDATILGNGNWTGGGTWSTDDFAKPLTINGTGFNNAGALENLAGNNFWNDLPITLGSDAAIGADGTSGAVTSAQVTAAGTVTITVPTPAAIANLSVGDVVTITANALAVANGTFKITNIAGTTFKISDLAATAPMVGNSGLNGTWTNNILFVNQPIVGANGTVTSADVNVAGTVTITVPTVAAIADLTVGNSVTIASNSLAVANGNFQITGIAGKTFTFANPAATTVGASGTSGTWIANFALTKVGAGTVRVDGKTGAIATVVGAGNGGVTQAFGLGGGSPIAITTDAPNTLATGQIVTIAGLSNFSQANGTFSVTVVNNTTFTLDGTSAAGLDNTSIGATWSTPIIVTTVAQHLLATGDQVQIGGVTGFNAALGTFTITTIDATHFSLDGTTALGTANPNTGAWTVGNNYTGLTDVHAGTLQLNVTNPALALQPNLAIPTKLQVGDATSVGQVQALDFTAGTQPFASGDLFTLSFNTAIPSAQVSYYKNGAYEAYLIQNALNNLASIGGLAIPGSVTVTPNGADKFLITFGGSLADVATQPAIVVTNNTNALANTSSTSVTNGGAPIAGSAVVQLLKSNQLATSSVVVVNSDGQFDINGQNQASAAGTFNQIAQLTVNTGLVTTNFAASGAGRLDVIGPVTLNAGGTLSSDGTGSQVNITGPLTVNSSNVYTPGTNSQVNVTGTTTIANGSNVNVSGSNSQVTVTGSTTVTNSNVNTSGSTSAATFNGALSETDSTFTAASGATSTITENGAFSMTGGAIHLQDANSQFVLGTGGSVTALSDALVPVLIDGIGTFFLNLVNPLFTILDGPSATDLFMNAKVGGATGLIKAGAGRLEFGKVNTYTGTTTIYSGDAQVDGAASVGNVQFSGTDLQHITLTGFSSGQSFTLTFGSNTTNSIACSSNPATEAAAIQAKLNLTSILGTGNTATVTATATADVYLVTFGGSLVGTNVAPLTGSPVGPATGTVAANIIAASLSGNGTVGKIGMANANVTGTVNPGVNTAGDHTGALATTGDVTWDANSTFWVDLTATPTNDVLNVTGNVNFNNAILTGTATLGIQKNQTYTILTYTGSRTGKFAQSFGADTVFINGQKFSITYDVPTLVPGTLSVVLTRVLDNLQSLTITAAPSSSTVYGQDVVFTATAVPETGAGVFPPGEVVNFVLDGTPITGTANGAGTITIDTASTTGLAAGKSVTIAGVGGDTAADGTWVISNVVANTSFDITATGTAVWTSGGVWSLIGQTVSVNTTSGVATFNPQSVAVGNFTWAVGNHTVDASFDDTNNPLIYDSMAASTFTQTVIKNSVNVGVTSVPVVSGAHPIYGEAVTVSANVTPVTPLATPNALSPTANSPTTTVTFTIDGGGAGRTFTTAVAGAQWTIPSADLPAGTHHVYVTYNGDGNYNASTTPFDFTLPISVDSTSVAFSPAPVPTQLGQTATFNVVVSPGVGVTSLGVPAGTMTFYDGTTANPPLNTTPVILGQTITLANFSNGDQFTLTFNGNQTTPITYSPVAATEAAALQSALNLTSIVGAGNTAIVTSTATPDVYLVTFGGGPITNVAMTGATTLPSIGTATGKVVGRAAFQTAGLSQGNRTIIAVFAPSDGNYAGSSQTTSFMVNAASTTTSFVSESPARPNFGDPVQFKVKVVPSDPLFPTGVFGSPGGSVTLWKNAVGTDTSGGDPNYLGTGSVNTGTGQATVTTVGGALPSPSVTILAHYVGTSSFAPSTGTLPSFAVAPASTMTSLIVNPGSAVYGQSVNLSAAVSSVSFPTGTVPQNSKVLFFADNALGAAPTDPGYLGTGIITNNIGRASINTTALSVNSHLIYAVYLDNVDGNYATSTSSGQGITVGQATSNVGVAASPSTPTKYGVPVTFTATVTAVSPGSGLPTNGTVNFYDGASVTPLNAAPITISGGVYAYTTNPSTQLSVGTHTITASFSGDTNLGNQTGQLVNYVVNAATTTVFSLTSSDAAGAVYGEPVQFTATINAIGGAPNPTSGSVVFKDGATTLGSFNLAGSNVATYTLITSPPQLSVATHSITATFQGNSPNYAASPQSAPLSQIVSAANTAITTFSALPANPGLGQLVTFTAQVSTTGLSAAAVNAGTVTFVDTSNGNLILGGVPQTVSATGVATVTASFATMGNHIITAKYNGFVPNFNASATVSLAPTLNVLKASVVNAAAVTNTFGQNLVYTVTVTSPQLGVPTGFVTLTEGGITPAGTIGGTLSNVGGVATTTITVPGGVENFGSHSFVFTYHDTSVTPVYADNVKNVTQTISAAGTVVTFTPAPQASVVYGTTVSYQGNVKTTAVGSTTNPLAGTVTLKDATTGTILGTPFILSGTNTFSFSSVALPLNVNIGAHSITANFTPGNTNFLANALAAQAAAPLTVAQALTQVSTPTSSVTSGPLGGSYFGQPVKFSVNVTTTNSPGTIVNGGSVSFYLNGATLLGNGNVVAGAASYTTTALQLPVNTVAGDKISAVYNSSNPASPTTANFKVSVASPQVTQFVSKAPTTVTLTSSLPGGSIYGNAVTFTAIVNADTVTNPGTPGTPPAATVAFYDGLTFLGNGTLVVGTTNKYTFTMALLTASGSPHSITATYAGTANFATGSNSISQTVSQAQTKTLLTTAPTVWATDAPITLTATISYVAGNAGSLITGATVTFMDGLNVLGTGHVVSSTATTVTYSYTVPANTLSIASHTITAVYSNTNANMAGSTSLPQTQNVHQLSKLTLTSSASPTAGTPVTYTATLTGVGGAPIPNATVIVNINGTTFTLTTNANGVAVISFTYSAAGTYAVTATFATDGIYNDVSAKLTTNVAAKITGRLTG